MQTSALQCAYDRQLLAPSLIIAVLIQDLDCCRTENIHVTLYEKEAHCGGHTLTDDTAGYPVDVGFQVSIEQVLPDRVWKHP